MDSKLASLNPEVPDNDDNSGLMGAFVLLCVVVAGLVIAIGYMIRTRQGLGKQKGPDKKHHVDLSTDKYGFSKDKKQRQKEREQKKREKEEEKAAALAAKKAAAQSKKLVQQEKTRTAQLEQEKLLEKKSVQHAAEAAESARQKEAQDAKVFDEEYAQELQQRRQDEQIVAEARSRGVTCRFIALGQQCHLGRKCKMSHVADAGDAGQDMSGTDAEDDNQIEPPWVGEFKLVVAAKKLVSAFEIRAQNSDGSGWVQLTINCVQIGPLAVELALPGRYPAEPVGLVVKSLSSTTSVGRRLLRTAAHEHCATLTGDQMLMNLCTWLAASAAGVLAEGDAAEGEHGARTRSTLYAARAMHLALRGMFPRIESEG